MGRGLLGRNFALFADVRGAAREGLGPDRFRRMPSLPQVLHEAVTRGAAEIIIEAGQAPMIRTAAGAVTVGDPLTESELFDALSQVLAPEQQAELAVGNVVEFVQFVDGGRWTLLTEPAAEGIVVRGKLQGGGSNGVELGTPLDLPPLDPIEPDRTDRAPRTSGPTTGLRRGRSTQWDLGVVSPTPDPSELSAEADGGAAKEDWLISNERKAADPLGEEPEFELRTPTGEQPANLVDAHDQANGAADLPEIIVPSLDEDSGPIGDRAVPDPAVAPLDVPLPTGGEHLPDDDLVEHASELGPGSLCLVADREIARRLAPMHGAAVVMIDAGPQGLPQQLDNAADVDAEATYLILLEDPSSVLGWALRRLEEGGRVIIASRARTPQGSLRSLLGLDAGPRAEEWMAFHTIRWLGPIADTWTLESL